MTTPAQVAKNSLLLFSSHLVAKIFLVLSSILLANYLGVQLFGTYSFAFALAALFAPLCDLGADAYLTRELAREQSADPRRIAAILSLKAALALITFLLIVAALQLFGYTEPTSTIVYLAASIMISRVYINTSFAVFRAFQRIKYESAVIVLQRALEFLVVLLVIALGLSILQLLLLILISLGASGVVSFTLLKKKFLPHPLQWRQSDIPAMLRGGLPFALTAIFVTIYFQIDSVMLSIMVGDESVGAYRSAYNLIFGLFIFSAAIVTTLYPFIARYHQTDRKLAVSVGQRAVRYSLMVGIPIALGCSLFSSEIMDLLYSDEYLNASITLSIIIWVLPMMYVTNILGHVLGAIQLQRMVVFVSIVNALFNVVLNLVLIPLYGQDGAALATVATEFLGLIILSIVVWSRFGRFVEFAVTGRILAASALLVPLYLFRDSLHFLAILPLAIFAYLSAAILLKLFSVAQVKNLFTQMIQHVREP